MTTKLLENILKKWDGIDREWGATDTSDCSDLGEDGENSVCDEHLCNKHYKMYRTEIADMIESLASKQTAKEIFEELDTCDDIVNDILHDESVQLIMGDDEEQYKTRKEVSRKIIESLIKSLKDE